MPMKIVIDHDTCLATIPPTIPFPSLIARIEGRKHCPAPGQIKFETTNHNLRAFKDLYPLAEVIDNRSMADSLTAMIGDISKGGNFITPVSHILPPPTWDIPEKFKWEPFPFQRRNYDRFKGQRIYAIFSEQGTGKTKTALDIASYRWHAKTLTGICILSWPSGVHPQWIHEQIPEHLWDGIPYIAAAWDGKKWPEWVGKPTPGKLQIIAANIEAVNFKCADGIADFLALHGRQGQLKVDESQTIMTWGSARSKKVRELGALAGQRSIMTGTPIAKNLLDEWSQFFFLDPDIIGHKYAVSFKAQYCIMGGDRGKDVVGSKNIEHFNSLVAPYIFRATKKEELDLPPKIYDEIVFDLTPEQKRHQKELRESFMTQFDNGEVTTLKTAATLVIRLQQIACGYLVDDDGTMHVFNRNPRLEALQALDVSRSGKKIIWCRFTKDVENVMSVAKPGQAVDYYGATTNTQRKHAKEAFMDAGSGVEWIVANAASMGAGVDGLQKVCQTAIYYSNSYNSIERWQSEDRIDRIGMIGSATYFDLIARGSVDRRIVNNLKQKKSFSDMVLGDALRQIRSMIENDLTH